MNSGKRSELIAGVHKIIQRRVQQLYKHYKDTGEIPVLQNCGRKKREITESEENIVLETHKEYKVNALALEKVINRQQGIHIPHNHIHKILKSNNKARDEPNKQKQRKSVKFL